MQNARSNRGEERYDEGRSLIKAESTAVGQERRDPYLSVALEAASEGDDISVTLRQYLHMVLKHRWLILGTVLVFFVLGGTRTLLQTPLYTATVSIQIDRESTKVIEGGATSPTEADSMDFMKTQYQLLKSRSMAERVASMLHLNDDETFFKPRDVSLLGILGGALSSTKTDLPTSAREAWAANIVLGNVTVSPVPGSRLVDVSYIDPSAPRAQKIANGYAEAYVASNLDKRFEANSYAKTFLEDQIKQLKLRLEESEKALLEFAEKEKMVEVNDKSSIAENNLAAANATVGQLISERIKDEQSWRQVENATAINLPQLLSNSVINILRGKRKELETEYQEKLENFKPGYPAMMQISNKIKETDRQLASEVKTIKNSLKAAFESSLAQEREMKARIEALREEVLDLQKKGIQYNILKREVETNRGLYNNLLQRYKEVDIAGGVGTNNIFIVDHATLPGSPSEPKVLRSLILSLALGFGAGIGMALLLEALDDRVRAPEEIERLTGIATLGIIPRLQTEEPITEVLNAPHSAIAEAYRSLATNLQFSTASGLPRSITVTSSGPSEGKSTTAIAIARHFGQIGLKVLLVDADLRKPSLHTKLQLSNASGLSNYLTGSSLPPEVIQKTNQPNLLLMTSGPLPPNAADLLNGTKLFSLVSLGSEVFDLIVFDSPPILGIADALLLAGATAATVFVVGAGEKSKGIIRSALRRLQISRVNPIGAVLTKFDPKTVGYAYGYSGEAYAYSYGGSIEQADHKRLGTQTRS